MAGFNRKHDFSVNTIIGPNSSVYGDVEAGGFTRVDGNLRGDLSVKGRVVVGEKARMKSNISGTSITIGGVVRGNIQATEQVVILSTALVVGDIITRRIRADEGCLIHGRVMVCTSDDKWNQAVSESEDTLMVKSALAGGNPAFMVNPVFPRQGEDYGKN
ncbi:MAG: polymer-forming cytoskeletal protein [Spirochaetaceae bacterium]|jgi:cytoskeletal protein CcmA (bactofilin family)|nr:polymer-forming cytoskeletal protein [Spirochaetaceae bacterium]